MIIRRFLLAAFVVVTTLGIFSNAIALDNTGVTNEYPGHLRGIRPLGMGNAFIAMPGTDHNAQYYNPAAINDYEKKHRFQLISPAVDFNLQILSTINDVKDLASDINDAATDSGRITAFDTFVQQHTGEFHRVGLGLPLFHLSHKYYAAGLNVDSRTSISLRNQSFPNFELKSVNDAGITGGTAYAFLDESLQVGVNLKFLYRAMAEEQVTSGEIVNASIGSIIGWSQWQKGFGVGGDIGAKYKLPWLAKLKPTVAVVVQDVGDTRFSGGASKQSMSVAAGGGIFPTLGKFEFAVLADFREINHKVDFLKKLHAGLEARFPEILKTRFALRAGTNQGYFATGFSANFPIVGLHFAFYGEEVGEYTRSKASYRLASQLEFEF